MHARTRFVGNIIIGSDRNWGGWLLWLRPFAIVDALGLP